MRNLSADTLLEIVKPRVRLFHLLTLVFPSGTERFTTYNRDIIYEGNTYLSDHNLINISNITEPLEQVVGTITLSVSGVDQANVAIALSENYTDAEVTIHRGFLVEPIGYYSDGEYWSDGDAWSDGGDPSSAYSVIADELFKGFVDSFNIQEELTSGTSEISWTVTSHWSNWQQRGGQSTASADQLQRYPGDDFFKFSEKLADQKLTWGNR